MQTQIGFTMLVCIGSLAVQLDRLGLIIGTTPHLGEPHCNATTIWAMGLPLAAKGARYMTLILTFRPV